MAYTISDIKYGRLKVGMKVHVSELADIHGVWMILKNPKFVTDEQGFGDTEGILHKISFKSIRITEPNTTLVYNTPYESREDILNAWKAV